MDIGRIFTWIALFMAVIFAYYLAKDAGERLGRGDRKNAIIEFAIIGIQIITIFVFWKSLK